MNKDCFGPLCFDCANCIIRDYSVKGNDFVLECTNGYSKAQIVFRGPRDFSPDKKILSGMVVGIRTRLEEDGSFVYRVELSKADLYFFDIIADSYRYIEL